MQQHISPALRSAAGKYDRRTMRTVTTDWFTVPRGELVEAAEVSHGPILADGPGCGDNEAPGRLEAWAAPRVYPGQHNPAVGSAAPGAVWAPVDGCPQCAPDVAPGDRGICRGAARSAGGGRAGL
jgi:hypothetical protein